MAIPAVPGSLVRKIIPDGSLAAFEFGDVYLRSTFRSPSTSPSDDFLTSSNRSRMKDFDNRACRLLAGLFTDLGGKRRKKAENLY
jgi:hypothetical protein